MSSHYKILPRILEIIHLNLGEIKRVLDYGAGLGRFGREFRIQFDEYLNEKKWKYVINAIEIFPAYRIILDRLNCYNSILDINKINDSHYDLIILMEVIEHLTKTEAIKLINHFKDISKFLIISTPMGFVKHNLVDGNPYQEHKCGFSQKELEFLGLKVEKIKTFEFTYFIAFSQELKRKRPLKYKIPLKIRQTLREAVRINKS